MSLAQRLADWDQTISKRLIVPRGARWRWLPALGAHLGDGALWALIGGALLVGGTAFLRALTLVASLAVVGAGIVATVVKYRVRRSRPQELTQFYALKYDRYSFPSGHATRMAAIAVIVGHFVPWMLPISYALALVVALCRVMVGVHYPSDVLSGIVIGSASAICVLLLV